MKKIIYPVIFLVFFTCYTTPVYTSGSIQKNNNVEFKTIKKGQYCGIEKAGNLVITSNEEWKKTWEGLFMEVEPEVPELPNVDFNKNQVIAVFMGQKGSGGYSVEITGVYEYEDKVIVNVLRKTPSADAMVSQAMTQPFHIILIPMINKQIIFK